MECRQSGVVMVLTLICLALMMIAAVALTRSSTNMLLQAGNFAFKRDLLNQGERGMAQALYTLQTGALASETSRAANNGSNNYSATQLSSNAQGIPLVLVNDSTFTSAGMQASDIADNDAGITIRTVVDRQCAATGAYTSTNCASLMDDTNMAGTARLQRVKGGGRATYRITVRVTGPRNTQAFQQMIVAL